MAAEAQTQQPGGAAVETREIDDFSAILKQSFKPRTERAATEVENAVATLVNQALADSTVIKGDVIDTIASIGGWPPSWTLTIASSMLRPCAPATASVP